MTNEKKETKERINITISPCLLSVLDSRCSLLNYNRSQLITRCIMYFIMHHYEDGEEK